MKTILFSAAFVAMGLTPAVVNAQADASAAPATAALATAAATPYYSAENSTVGELLDNPETKAIVEKHFPGMTTNEQIDMARGMTLKALQQYSADVLTDDALAKCDADLAKVAAPKS